MTAWTPLSFRQTAPGHGPGRTFRRLTKPRIAPVQHANLDADQAEILKPMAETGRVLNIFRTMVNAPKAARGFLAWGNYVLSRRNDLPAREREIGILRIGYLCKSGYEWTPHVAI